MSISYPPGYFTSSPRILFARTILFGGYFGGIIYFATPSEMRFKVPPKTFRLEGRVTQQIRQWVRNRRTGDWESPGALFPALCYRSFVSVSITVSVVSFRIAVTVSAPCTHHGYVNDGNHFTFLCSSSPVRLVPNGRVELPGWPGLAG